MNNFELHKEAKVEEAEAEELNSSLMQMSNFEYIELVEDSYHTKSKWELAKQVVGLQMSVIKLNERVKLLSSNEEQQNS